MCFKVYIIVPIILMLLNISNDCYGQNQNFPSKTSIRTNLLLDAVAVPNIGAEVFLGGRCSAEAQWMYAWWHLENKDIFWRIYGGQIGFRKYFGEKLKDMELSGHHIGVYGQAFTYDFGFGSKGETSKFTYGGGLDYGYCLPVSGRIAFDFSVGLGFLSGEYKTYKYDKGCYVWQETRIRRMMSPTKAEIALVINIGKQE